MVILNVVFLGIVISLGISIAIHLQDPNYYIVAIPALIRVGVIMVFWIIFDFVGFIIWMVTNPLWQGRELVSSRHGQR